MTKRYMLYRDDVEDNLTSTYTDVPLSAKQGKILNENKLDAPAAAPKGSIIIHNGTEWTTQEGYGLLDGAENLFDDNLAIPAYTGTWTDVCSGELIVDNQYVVQVPGMSLKYESSAYNDGTYNYVFSESGGEPSFSADAPVVLRCPDGGGTVQIACAIDLPSTRVTLDTYTGITRIDSRFIPFPEWSNIQGRPFSDVDINNGLTVDSDDKINILYGATGGTVCEGNDTRLSDARSPTNHAANHVSGSDVIQPASESQDGLLSATDWYTFNSKQNAIDDTHKISSLYVDDSVADNKFVTATDKTNWNGKQDALVSGVNIKTVNSQSLLGSGDITIGGSSTWGGITGTLSDQTDLQDALDGKVNTESGKGLSTNDFTDTYKDAVDTNTTNITTLQTDVTSLQTEVSNKVDKVAGKGLSTNDYTTAEKTALANLKSQSESGKVLSDENFTTVLKTKLDGIAVGAEVNVQTDWNQTDTAADDYLKNKPSSFTPSLHASTHEKGGSDEINIDASQITSGTIPVSSLPIASTSGAGLVKIGSGVQVTPDGVISIPGTITYTITVTPGANGTITPGTGSYSAGQTATFSILPNTGYEIDDVLIDGSSVGAVSSYTFTNLANNHTVSASFKVKTYTVSATVVGGTGGTISASPTTVNHNGSSTITVTASSGYSVKSFKINGTATTLSGTTYTITNITANQTVTVEFQSGYSVTCSVVGGVGGTISASPTSVTPGGSSTITVTPATGYSVKEFKVNGTAKTLSGTTYTISSINSDQTVTVEFQEAQTGSYYIDLTEIKTAPTTCVHYLDGGSKTTFAAFAESLILPSVVKNGTVNYLLDKTNLNKKSDGTASNLTGTDGDVMASLKPFWWKIDTSTSNRITVTVKDVSFDGAISAHLFNSTIRKYLHLGMFHSTVQACTSIYSTSAKPKASVTNDNFRTSTIARGDTYNILTYLSWSAYMVLAVGASGSCDLQSTIAQDYTGLSFTGSPTYVSTSAMLTCGGKTGSTSSTTTSAMYLFLANPWGNVRDWVAGLKGYNGNYAVCTDQYYARNVSISDTSLPTTGWTTFAAPTTNVSGYITAVKGINAAPFFPTASSSGSSSTYFCDEGYTSKSTGPYCGGVGGTYFDGADAGLFSCYADNGASDASAYVGARLQVHDTEDA